jgi:hypothetical protein
MINWDRAYARQRTNPDFIRYFGGGPANQPPPAHYFRYIAYTQQLGPCVGNSTPVQGFGAQVGPVQQNFPAGAVILGISATAFQEQATTGSFQYAPWAAPGRRDLFGLSFTYTNDEVITPNGPILANALLGDGDDTVFPGRELLVPPSQGLLATAASFTVAPSIYVHLVYHAMVPRAVG